MLSCKQPCYQHELNCKVLMVSMGEIKGPWRLPLLLSMITFTDTSAGTHGHEVQEIAAKQCPIQNTKLTRPDLGA